MTATASDRGSIAVAARPVRAASALTLAKVGAALTSAAWLVVAGRSLSVGDFADLALLLALAVIFVAVSDAGLSVRLAEVVATRPDAARTFAALAVRRRLVTGTGAAVLLVASFAVAGRGSVLLAVIMAVSVVATSVHSALATALRAVGRVGPEAVTEVASRVAVLLVGLVALPATGSVTVAVALYGAADLTVLAVMTAAARSLPADPTADRTRLGWRHLRHLAFTLPLATVYWRLDIWVLALLGTATDVARYGVSYRILDAALLPTMVVGSLTAAAVAASPTGAVVARRYALGAVVTVLPVVVGGIALGGPLLGLLFGAEYRGAAGILTVLLVAALPSAVIVPLVQALAVVAPVRLTVGVVGAAVVSGIGNLALVPAHGAAAAAALTLASQSGLLAWLLVNLRPPAVEVGVPEVVQTA